MARVLFTLLILTCRGGTKIDFWSVVVVVVICYSSSYFLIEEWGVVALWDKKGFQEKSEHSKVNHTPLNSSPEKDSFDPFTPLRPSFQILISLPIFFLQSTLERAQTSFNPLNHINQLFYYLQASKKRIVSYNPPQPYFIAQFHKFYYHIPRADKKTDTNSSRPFIKTQTVFLSLRVTNRTHLTPTGKHI